MQVLKILDKGPPKIPFKLKKTGQKDQPELKCRKGQEEKRLQFVDKSSQTTGQCFQCFVSLRLSLGQLCLHKPMQFGYNMFSETGEGG